MECTCDLRTKLVGDGCVICNPAAAAELQANRKRQEEALATMSEDDKRAALRFCETCDDDQGYDLPRAAMTRLATLGLVADKHFGRYEQTDLLLDIRDRLEGEFPAGAHGDYTPN